jgi:hypothetical protein
MFFEILDCMAGDLKYIHMMDYKMFIELSNKYDILTKSDSEEFLINNNFIFVLRENIYTEDFRNVFSCTFISKNLSLRNFIFAEYDGQFYKLNSDNLEELYPESLKEYCEHNFPYATTFKHLIRTILKI